ncbi:MAG: ATP-binding protein [Vicinamibacterales bacterium]
MTSNFLGSYRADGISAPRLERVLAVGRAFLAVVGLLAIYLDPTEPRRLAVVAYTLLAAYALFSLAVLAWVQLGRRVTGRHGLAFHVADMLWASALTFVSDGAGSPLFLFFVFVVVASAYRWGFRETVATTVGMVVVFLLETAAAAAGPWRETLLATDLEVNRTILRIGYLLLTGFLLGYLAEQEKQSRAELGALANLPLSPRIDLDLRGSITTVADDLLRIFRATDIAFVIDDVATVVATSWTHRSRSSASAADIDRRELDPAELADWLFEGPGRSWHVKPQPGGSGLFQCVSTESWALKRVTQDVPDRVTLWARLQPMIAIDVGAANEWRGRIYLAGFPDGDDMERVVHFLDAVGAHVTPALTNLFLLRRLHQQESAAERARVARELHDGAIQALIGIEMKIEAMLRSPAERRLGQRGDLADIQLTVRQEVVALRELMHALRPIEIDAHENLPDVLAGVVERFRRDSGMPARFIMSGDAPAMRPAAALEIVRIVQEALVNARRHSRAHNVFVRLTPAAGGYRLSVEDDGTGFSFEGRLTSSELDERRIGPAIIKERARLLGGHLVVQSTPGSGSRIELTFAGQG